MIPRRPADLGYFAIFLAVAFSVCEVGFMQERKSERLQEANVTTQKEMLESKRILSAGTAIQMAHLPGVVTVLLSATELTNTPDNTMSIVYLTPKKKCDLFATLERLRTARSLVLCLDTDSASNAAIVRALAEAENPKTYLVADARSFMALLN